MQSIEIFSIPWIIAFCVSFFAAVIRGMAGFGFALILTPILLIFLTPIATVVLVLILGVLSNMYVIFRSFQNIDFKRILPMGISSLGGIPLGLWIITVTEPSIMKIIIGSIIIIFAVPVSLGFQKSFRYELVAFGFAGFIGGVLAGSTSFCGPPAVIVMHAHNWSKEKIHPSLAAYFSFAGIFTLTAYYISGQMDIKTVITAASLIPAMMGGVLLGMTMFRRTDVRFYRYISMIIIICAGIFSIISAVQAIY